MSYDNVTLEEHMKERLEKATMPQYLVGTYIIAGAIIAVTLAVLR